MGSTSEADASGQAPRELVGQDQVMAYRASVVRREPNCTLQAGKTLRYPKFQQMPHGQRLDLSGFNDPAKSKTTIIGNGVARRTILRADRCRRTSRDPRRFERPCGVTLSEWRRAKE